MAEVDYVVEVESAALKRTLRSKLGGKMRVRRRPGRRYVHFVEIKRGISAPTAVSSELAFGVFVGIEFAPAETVLFGGEVHAIHESGFAFYIDALF